MVQDLVKSDENCAYGVLVQNVSDSPTLRQITYLPRKRRAMFVLYVGIFLHHVVSSSVGAYGRNRKCRDYGLAYR